MVQNKAFMYKSVPDGWPVPGKDLTIESTEFEVDADPPEGGFTTKNLYATYDPSQRGRMRDPNISSYSPAMVAGEPVVAVSVLGKVLKSNNASIEAGTLVHMTSSPTESYSKVSAEAAKKAKVIKPIAGVPLTAHIGVLGMTGLTAYGSLHEIGRPKKGETIWISGAAGAVGQVVGQIAVREGLHVIGSVGEDRKLDFITKELGFTSGFNYKKETPADALKRLAPDGIDIYYDNVGGEQLDEALRSLRVKGRIISCGSISQYNKKTGEKYGVKNTGLMVTKRISWQGFLVIDPEILQHAEARDRDISAWIADGSFKTIDHVTDGMDNAIDGFIGMLRGENLGKAILKIASE